MEKVSAKLMRKRRVSIWLLLVVFALGMMSARFALHHPSGMFLQISAQEESTWRKTRFGWMDSSKWERPEPVAYERRIELVHPLLFSAIIILVTTGFLIWSSEERQWAEIFESGKSDDSSAD